MDPPTARSSPVGRARRTSRSPRFCSRARCGRTCARSTASPGSWTCSATRSPGDRLAALDELEAQVEACYGGEPDLGGDARAAADDPRLLDLPREPFLRLIEANRMDQRSPTYETWADLKGYCVHSADPVGRLVLGVLRRGRRRRRGRALATTSAPGSSSSTSFRTCRATSPSGGSTCRRRTGGASASTELDRPKPRAAAAARVRGRAGAGPARVRARSCGGGSAARRRAGGRRSSRAAAWRRSRRSSAPTGTSSPGGRGHLARGSRARPWRCSR